KSRFSSAEFLSRDRTGATDWRGILRSGSGGSIAFGAVAIAGGKIFCDRAGVLTGDAGRMGGSRGSRGGDDRAVAVLQRKFCCGQPHDFFLWPLWHGGSAFRRRALSVSNPVRGGDRNFASHADCSSAG